LDAWNNFTPIIVLIVLLHSHTHLTLVTYRHGINSSPGS
jgi:hypothetical protein